MYSISPAVDANKVWMWQAERWVSNMKSYMSKYQVKDHLPPKFCQKSPEMIFIVHIFKSFDEDVNFNNQTPQFEATFLRIPLFSVSVCHSTSDQCVSEPLQTWISPSPVLFLYQSHFIKVLLAAGCGETSELRLWDEREQRRKRFKQCYNVQGFTLHTFTLVRSRVWFWFDNMRLCHMFLDKCINPNYFHQIWCSHSFVSEAVALWCDVS